MNNKNENALKAAIPSEDAASAKKSFLRPNELLFQDADESESEANARLNLMINTIPLLVTYWSADYTIKKVNQYALDFYGNDSLEEGVPDVYEVILKGTEWFERLDEIFLNGSGSFHYKDGLSNFWEVEGVRTTYNGEVVVITYGKHVTHILELQAEQRRREVAEESSKAKSIFIANISHEIRTPMNSIIGYSELALDDEISDNTREHLQRILTSAKWLLDIVNDVLDISKIESGLLQFEKTTFDIDVLMQQCKQIILPIVGDKEIDLGFNVDSSVLNGKHLIGDPVKITQICINILSNAVKFTNAGGSIRTNVVAEDAANNNATISFEFSDTGVGMTDEQMTRIFEPFMQADSSTTRAHDGTGLGLAISKHLVNAMGGELIVKSKSGVGSTFSFSITLPTKSVGTENLNKLFKVNPVLPKPFFKKGEVLVVDDNEMNLDVACEHLIRVGLTPTVARNGKEAVDEVKHRLDTGKTPYDLVLMDFHMPVMDGKEASSIISGWNVGTPIVAMTADASVMSSTSLLVDYGISECLGKPFTAQELWQCLINYFEPEAQN